MTSNLTYFGILKVFCTLILVRVSCVIFIHVSFFNYGYVQIVEERLEDDWVPLEDTLGPEELEERLRSKEAHTNAAILESVRNSCQNSDVLFFFFVNLI